MRRASPLGVLAGAALAACFAKPGPPTGANGSDSGTTGDGALGDGMTTDVLIQTCQAFSFDTPSSGCGGWGNLDSGSASTSSSRLHLTAMPSGSTTSAGRCLASPAPVTRATIDLASVPVLSTNVRLRFFLRIGGLRYGAELTGSGGSNAMLVKCDMATAGSDSWFSPTRYVRLLMTSSNTVTVQLSSNAVQWDDLGACMVPIADAEFGLEVERIGSGSSVTVTYESLEICE